MKLAGQKEGKLGGDKALEPCSVQGVSELHIRSIRGALCDAVNRSAPCLPSPASPLPLALPASQQFKQTFRYSDNDLSAPFRQDLTIKRPALHVLAPADAAAEKFARRRDALLQETLKQNHFLGPGHMVAAMTGNKYANGIPELSTALNNLSKQHAARAKPGSIARHVGAQP
jgi:hypothetical protein